MLMVSIQLVLEEGKDDLSMVVRNDKSVCQHRQLALMRSLRGHVSIDRDMIE